MPVRPPESDRPAVILYQSPTKFWFPWQATIVGPDDVVARNPHGLLQIFYYARQVVRSVFCRPVSMI